MIQSLIVLSITISCTTNRLGIKVAEGDYAKVKEMIEDGADVNARSKGWNRDWTMLMGALNNGHQHIAKLLIENGADVNAKDDRGATALFYCYRYDDAEIVTLLIGKGAEVNDTDQYGNTVLFYMIDEYLIRLLIENGAEVNTKNNFGVTPLHEASDRIPEVARLLVHYEADVNAKDVNGVTPLMRAAEYGIIEVVRLLVEHGADVNAQTTSALYEEERCGCGYVGETYQVFSSGTSALMFACIDPFYGENIEVVRLLIANGADIDARDGDGQTALMFASFNGITEIEETLKDAGAKE